MQLGPPGRAAILPSGAGAAFLRAAAPRKWGETPGLCKLGAQLGAAVVISAAHGDSGYGCSFCGRIGRFPPNSWDRRWIQIPVPSEPQLPAKLSAAPRGQSPPGSDPFPVDLRHIPAPLLTPARLRAVRAVSLRLLCRPGRQKEGRAMATHPKCLREKGWELGVVRSEEQGES